MVHVTIPTAFASLTEFASCGRDENHKFLARVIRYGVMQVSFVEPGNRLHSIFVFQSRYHHIISFHKSFKTIFLRLCRVGQILLQDFRIFPYELFGRSRCRRGRVARMSPLRRSRRTVWDTDWLISNKRRYSVAVCPIYAEGWFSIKFSKQAKNSYIKNEA